MILHNHHLVLAPQHPPGSSLRTIVGHSPLSATYSPLTLTLPPPSPGCSGPPPGLDAAPKPARLFGRRAGKAANPPPALAPALAPAPVPTPTPLADLDVLGAETLSDTAPLAGGLATPSRPPPPTQGQAQGQTFSSWDDDVPSVSPKTRKNRLAAAAAAVMTTTTPEKKRGLFGRRRGGTDGTSAAPVRETKLDRQRRRHEEMEAVAEDILDIQELGEDDANDLTRAVAKAPRMVPTTTDGLEDLVDEAGILLPTDREGHADLYSLTQVLLPAALAHAEDPDEVWDHASMVSVLESELRAEAEAARVPLGGVGIAA